MRQFMNISRFNSKHDRLFYLMAAILLLVPVFLGFQQFYLHGRAYPNRELAQPIQTLLIFHGMGMTAWILLFIIQPLLIVAGNYRIHMLLGKVGAVLAAYMIALGLRLGIEAMLITPPDLVIWGLSPKQFLAVPILGITVFAGFVVAGVWMRHKPEAHRPLMLLATLSVLSAAVSRIDSISLLYRNTVWASIFGPFFGTLVIGGFLLAVHWLLSGKLNLWFAMGYMMLMASAALIMQLASSRAWAWVANLLLQ